MRHLQTQLFEKSVAESHDVRSDDLIAQTVWIYANLYDSRQRHALGTNRSGRWQTAIAECEGDGSKGSQAEGSK